MEFSFVKGIFCTMLAEDGGQRTEASEQMFTFFRGLQFRGATWLF
jgi:hypothetical protein